MIVIVVIDENDPMVDLVDVDSSINDRGEGDDREQ